MTATIRKHCGYLAPWRATCTHGTFWARPTWAQALSALTMCGTADDLAWEVQEGRAGQP